MAIISDTFRVLFNYRQCNTKSLQDYTKYFKVSKKILNSYLDSPIIIKKIMKNHPNYNKIDQVVVNELTEEVVLSYVFTISMSILTTVINMILAAFCQKLT